MQANGIRVFFLFMLKLQKLTWFTGQNPPVRYEKE
jgi:hypothetical protein